MVQNWKQEAVELGVFLDDVVGQIREGKLVLQGFARGSSTSSVIDVNLLDFVEPDFQHDTLECNGVTFSGVRITREATAQTLAVVAKIKLDNPAGGSASIKSAGRPSSKRLVDAELDRRAERGQLAPSRIAEARELIAWLLQAHPDERYVPTPKSLAERISARYYELVQRAENSKSSAEI